MRRTVGVLCGATLLLGTLAPAAAASGAGAATSAASAAQSGSAATAASAAQSGSAAAQAKGPVGWNVYRDLNDLSHLTEGVQTEQSSSTDPTGGNNDSDHCLASTATEGCVLAQHDGPGEIDSIWQTAPGGQATPAGNLHIVLDGKTVVDAPWEDVVEGKLGAPFVSPLVEDASQTFQATLITVPMPFRSSMLVYSDHDPDYFHVTYRTFADAAGVTTFDPSDKALDVIATLRRAGTADPMPPQPGAVRHTHHFSVAPHAAATVATAQGPGEITALRLHLPQLSHQATAAQVAAADTVLADTRLQISFDGRQLVSSPLGELFGSGLGDSPVTSLMFAMDPTTGWLSAWWPMPYRTDATVRLVDHSSVPITAATVQLTTAPEPSMTSGLLPGGGVGYFHTTSHAGPTSTGVDWNWIDASGQGKFVGVTQAMRGPSLTYLEGDERAYVDGSSSPQIDGTGTEDYFEGGWYFDAKTFSNPLQGSPEHEGASDGCPQSCTQAYRLMLADAVPFGSSLDFGIEHGPTDDVAADYSTTAYWYGQSEPDLRWTDTLTVGSPASEATHHYRSSAVGGTAGPVGARGTPSTGTGTAQPLTATYAGNDGTPQPVTATTRQTSAPVSFRLAIDPHNRGVLVLRTSDQAQPFQQAAVTIDGHAAGTWLEPSGNTWHRWLDDWFQIPASITAGRRSITVTLAPTSGSPPWSAAAYQAISVVAPFVDRQPPSPVTGLHAQAAANTVSLAWTPSTDNVYAPHYRIYASTDRTFTPGAGTLIGTSSLPVFQARNLGLDRTWYFRVRAVDAAGNLGTPSPALPVRIGDTVHVQAQSLLPPAASSGSVEAQSVCCGVRGSSGTEVLLGSSTPGASVRLDFRVPQSGTYALSVVQTMSFFSGVSEIRIDGRSMGQPFDGFTPSGTKIAPPRGAGQVALDVGTHTLTLAVTGKNPAAASYAYSAGLESFTLRLLRPGR